MLNKYDFTIIQGSTFETSIQWVEENTPKNLTGYTAQMQMRASYKAAAAVDTFSSITGEIILTPADGTISFFLDAARTAALKVDLGAGKPPKSVYVYDLEMIGPDGKVVKLLYGDVTVIGEVTRL